MLALFCAVKKENNRACANGKYRKAPKLYHQGSKPKGNFYQLPHSLMNAVFQKFDGKNGNAIKLLVVMIGSAGDGSFALSEKMIEARTGISKSNYHRTMDSLEASGYVVRENGKVILNLPLLMEDKRDDDQESHRHTEISCHDDETTHPDDDYNRRAEASRHEEGIGDISELLDDWGKEEKLYAHHAPSGPSMLQEVLAEAKRQKKAELFGWEDDDDDDEL